MELSASPASGSQFDGWIGACTGTGDCSITLGRDESVTASFVAVPPPSIAFTSSDRSATPQPTEIGVVGSTRYGFEVQNVDTTRLQVTWDFGDGSTARGTSVGHAYQEPGTFTITASLVPRSMTPPVGASPPLGAPAPFFTTTVTVRSLTGTWRRNPVAGVGHTLSIRQVGTALAGVWYTTFEPDGPFGRPEDTVVTSLSGTLGSGGRTMTLVQEGECRRTVTDGVVDPQFRSIGGIGHYGNPACGTQGGWYFAPVSALPLEPASMTDRVLCSNVPTPDGWFQVDYADLISPDCPGDPGSGQRNAKRIHWLAADPIGTVLSVCSNLLDTAPPGWIKVQNVRDLIRCVGNRVGGVAPNQLNVMVIRKDGIGVHPPPPPATPDHLVLQPSDLAINAGDAARLDSRVIAADGRDITDQISVAGSAWTSDDPTVASVEGGVVTGNRAGSTVVRVTLRGQSASAAVRVSWSPFDDRDDPDRITLNTRDFSMAVGESRVLSATVMNRRGEDMTDRVQVTWTLMDSKALLSATTGSRITITGVSAGRTFLTASVNPRLGPPKTASIDIRIGAPPASMPDRVLCSNVPTPDGWIQVDYADLSSPDCPGDPGSGQRNAKRIHWLAADPIGTVLSVCGNLLDTAPPGWVKIRNARDLVLCVGNRIAGVAPGQFNVMVISKNGPGG